MPVRTFEIRHACIHPGGLAVGGAKLGLTMDASVPSGAHVRGELDEHRAARVVDEVEPRLTDDAFAVGGDKSDRGAVGVEDLPGGGDQDKGGDGALEDPSQLGLRCLGPHAGRSLC